VGQRSTEQNLAAVSRHFSFTALADLSGKNYRLCLIAQTLKLQASLIGFYSIN
jgi:hypothetical protein